MHSLRFLYPAFLAALALVGSVDGARKPSNSVLLSNVQTLTLRKDLKTSHRRVSAIPQLKCVGGNAKGLYEVDVMRCKNAGSDYDDDNIQWTCTASLPEDFKLGSTDVICEGYESPNDPYILKGSCGVEYRLVLTEKGEERHPKKGWFSGPGKDNNDNSHDGYESSTADRFVAGLFWIIFIAVVLWMLFSACVVRGGEARRPDTWRPGWGDGGGWGGGDDPPPPYDWRPSPKPRSYGQPEQAWRPGFWSGTAVGAAGGYMAGSRGNRTAPSPPTQRSGGWSNGGGGSSTRSGSSGSSGSSARHESTGFGSTSRR